MAGVLVAITVATVSIVNGVRGFSESEAEALPPAPPSATVKAKAKATEKASTKALPKTVKPAVKPKPKPQPKPQPRPKAVAVPTKGPGTYRVAKRDLKPANAKGKLVRYSVEVEKGLPFDPIGSATLIHQVLNDKRSWSGSGAWRFELVSSTKKADLRVYVATGKTTDKLCAPLNTHGDLSCQNGSRVVLNATRWGIGAKSYGSDVANYRRYLVNHEVGHYLGKGHVKCGGKGKQASVMLQQSKGLDGCKANPWPAPKR